MPTEPPDGEKIADGQHPIADADLIAVPERDRHQRVIGGDLEHGDIGLGVATHHLCLEVGVIVQDHGDLVGVLDDVVIGDHPPLFGVDDEARTKRRGVTGRGIGFLALVVKEILEKIFERRTRRELRQFGRVAVAALALGDGLSGRDVDHGGQQAIGQIGKTLGRRPSPRRRSFGLGGGNGTGANRHPKR